MIPNNFEYIRANSVQEALQLLSQKGDGARLLAGGHSLIPAMKLRLNAPETVIDISGIQDLASIHRDGGRLHIGALVTHRTVETSDEVKSSCPVLSEAAALIGDPLVRNRGTIGGSLAHCDPAADYPALTLCLDAEIEATGPSGSRTIAADDFFVGMFETALQPGEMITRVTFPVLTRGTGAAYEKFSHPASRFAVVGVAAMVTLDGSGNCSSVRVAITGAGPSVFRATKVEQALTGKAPDEQAISDATQDVADPADLMSDISASAEYRAHLCSVLSRRALQRAVQAARG
ncbi:MAG: xanthine dehydrogenase family protein subunit M [candidate division KSB1 bacterium]|nr:xanthine dehydrogenase family protein subunit M [candidate division KSB1 bacterium]MDQ7064999.1 xanthine dehydrogenase family protein subunit M [candidate division KSB1 bacterium]